MRANRFVSYLATEIEPQAFSTLARFERATDQAFDRIGKFNDRGAARIGTAIGQGFNQRTQQAVARTATELSRVSRESDVARVSLGRAAAEANVMSTAMFRSAQALNVVQGPLGPLAGRLSSLAYIFRDLAGISLAAVLGGGGAFAIGGIASSYENVTNRLRPFYETQERANAAMNDVIVIARNTRQALDPVAQLYSRLDQTGTRFTSTLTDTIAKAARLSGGDTQTQNAGITQFMQGFGSGNLAGDELRSIRENTFRLAKGIADGLGVSIAALKDLGSEGKLTQNILEQALLRSADIINLEFSRMPKTIGQALTEMSNNLGIYIGRLNEATGATQGFAKIISLIGGNIDTVAAGVVGLATVFAVRNLANPIERATAALGGFIQTQRMMGDARRGAPVTPLTPEGIARAKANSAVDNAVGDQQAADAAVRRDRAALFAANQRVAAAREAQAAALGEQRAIEAGAVSSVAQAQRRVDAARQELALANQTAVARRAADLESARTRLATAREELALAKSVEAQASQRVIAARNATEAAGSGPGSRSDRSRAAATAARQQVVAEAELAASQERLAAAQARVVSSQASVNAARGSARAPLAAQTAATEALAHAERNLTAATIASANAQSVAATRAAANQRTGFAFLSVVEDRVRGEAALQSAMRVSATANDALATATSRATVAQRAFQTASALTTRAMNGLRAAGSALSGLLGGPLGIALTAATVGFTLLASRTSQAEEAAARFQAAQDELASKLGTTTTELQNQSAAARQLAADLARAGLEQAKSNRLAAASDLGDSLLSAQWRINLASKQGRADYARIGEIGNALNRGQSIAGYEEISALARRNPEAFKSSSILGMVARDPAKFATYSQGYIQTAREEQEAKQRVLETERRLRNPEKLEPIDLSGGVERRTTQQLQAEAADLANGGTALQNARREFNKTKADLDAELKKRRDAGDYTFDDEYVRRLASAQDKLDGVGAAQRSAAAGARENNKAIREQNAALKEAEQNANKLAQIQSRYTDEPTAARRGELDKAALDSLFVSIKDGKTEIRDVIQLLNSETGKLEPFTRADAEEVKRSIDYGVRRPIREALAEQENELQIADLILSGRADEAELLRTKLQWVQRVGDVTADEEAQLARNLLRQREINRAIEDRNRLIDVQARTYGEIQGAIRDSIITGPQALGGLVRGAGTLLGGLLKGQSIGSAAGRAADVAGPGLQGVASVFERLMGSFQEQVAEKLSLTLFGDAEARAREAMQNAFQTSADRLSGSASDLTNAARALAAAGGAPGLISGVPSVDNSGAFATFAADLQRSLGSVVESSEETGSEIKVVGRALARQDPTKMSIEQRYNVAGQDFAAKIFGESSPLTRAASKLGTFLSGAQMAPIGLAGSQLFGSKGSGLGAAIGGGLGKALLGGENGILSKGLGTLGSKLGANLGQFAGPLGSVLGSITGSLIGGLFGKKAPQSNAQVTDGAVTASGSSSGLSRTAGGLGDSVAGGVNRIAQALGGSVGGYRVSIGTYNGEYRVSTSGQTGEMSFGKKNKNKSTLFNFGDDQQAAIQFAILDALKDGAIKGIREGARRLLMAGKDLDSALQNAVDFQNVFRELKQYTDPVGAAIDDLNMQFDRLIDLFNQAGASAEEFADLEKLYELKRADAIKQASNNAVANLQSFIDNLKGGSDSPLGRRTVYNNARAQVDQFRADLAAGKTVDNDKLLEALSNYQDASRNLNGSRGAFFNDFNDILALAESAKANLQAGQGALPGSPFDPATQAAIADTANNTASMNQTMAAMLAEMKKANGGRPTGGSYAPDGSALDYLRNMQMY